MKNFTYPLISILLISCISLTAQVEYIKVSFNTEGGYCCGTYPYGVRPDTDTAFYKNLTISYIRKEDKLYKKVISTLEGIDKATGGVFIIGNWETPEVKLFVMKISLYDREGHLSDECFFNSKMEFVYQKSRIFFNKKLFELYAALRIHLIEKCEVCPDNMMDNFMIQLARHNCYFDFFVKIYGKFKPKKFDRLFKYWGAYWDERLFGKDYTEK